MAVNGVEIIEGSEWVTKDGRSGRITRKDNDKTYCWWLTFLIPVIPVHTQHMENTWLENIENMTYLTL